MSRDYNTKFRTAQKVWPKVGEVPFFVLIWKLVDKSGRAIEEAYALTLVFHLLIYVSNPPWENNISAIKLISN